MRKFTMYNLQFTIILLVAAVFVMFAAPATASAAPSATISGDAWTWVNQTFWFRATIYNAGSGQIYITREDGNSFTCPSGLAGRWCLIGTRTYASNGTSFWASFTPREYGTYRITTNAYTNSTASFTGDRNTECTGNPFGYNTNQWSDCGSSDNMSATVYVKAPTPRVSINNSCISTDTGNLATISWDNTSPQVSYVDISSNSFSGWNYKYVAGSTSTNASTGFSSAYNVSGPLNFIPGTWYTARLWNGSAHSDWAWFYAPAACPPPRGSLSLTSGSQSIKPGNTNSFRADLTNAGSGQIWVTKGDGRSSFTCPNGIYGASTSRYWCPIVRNSGSTLTGSYNFAEPGSYTVVINAFTKSDQSGTGPADQCSGTPDSLGFDSSKWSDCGGSSRMTVTVTPDCNTGVDCSLCSAPSNTCSANNGTQLCYYRSYTGGGSCNVVSFNQSCTINKCSSGYSCVSGSCTAPPPAPSNPSASCPAPGTAASLSWSGVNSASRYDVYVFDLAYGSPNWNSACGSNGRVVCQQVNGTSMSFSTAAGKQYQWFVFACNSVGCSSTPASYSTSFTCTPPNCNTNPDCDLCSVPTNTCSANNGNQICYYRGYSGGGSCNVVSFGQSCTRSNCSSGYTCSNGACIPPPPTAAISSPSNNSSATISQNTAVSATANGTNLTRMDIYRAPKDSNSWTKIAEKTCSGSSCSLSSSWTPTAAEAGQWKIAVNAFDSYDQRCSGMQVTQPSYWTAWCGRNGSTSNVMVNVVPPLPTGLAGSCPIPGTTGNFSWNTVSGATSYNVFVSTAGHSYDWSTCSSPNICVPVGNTTSYNLSNLSPGTSYQWYVASCNGSSCGNAVAGSNFTCTPTPPPPTANLNAPVNNSSNIIGQSMVVSATAAGTNLKKINIYRAPKGSNNWTRIAENDTCGGESICGVSSSWTPTASEIGQWDISVNAFDNYGQQCSGMHTTPGGYWTANCDRNGSTSNVMVNVVFPSPTAQITSPINNSSFTVGLNIPVEAAAQIPSPGSLTKGELWVTNATDPNNPILPVGCPGTTSGYWCLIIDKPLSGTSAAFSGNWTPRAVGTYRIAVNAFDDVNKTKCTGNPFTAIPAGWSSCGSYRWTQISVVPPPPPPTANISAPDNDNYTIIDNAMTVSATANGTNLTRMDIYRAPKDSNSWTKIAEKTCSGSSCSLSSSWTPTAAEAGQWKIAVNAFDSYDQRCSGMQVTQPSYWTAWCGRNGSTSNVTVNAILPPPQATISGPKTAIANDSPPSYTAILSGGTQSGQIWVTKEDGLFTFPCTTQMIQASTTRRYWCLAGQGTEQFITGSYNFQEQGNYTVVVNAFNRADLQGSSQADRCTGTPDNLAKDSAGNDVTWSSWSKCDPDDPKKNNSRAYIPVAVSEPLTTTNCGGGINPRAEGLVTTPSLTGKFGTSPEGRCIKDDPKTIFTTFKIPTYNDLKSIYYTQAKSSSTAIKEPPQASGPINLTGKDHIYNITGDLTISNPSDITGTKTGIIFVEGNLKIGPIPGNKLNYGNNNSGLVFVVRGNVNIESSVTQVDAIIMSEGNICTAANGTACLNGTTVTPQLTIDGSLIALDPTKPIQFRRNLNRNDCPSCAAEIINNRPKYLVILSNLFASTLQKWSDVTAGGSVVPTNCKAFNGNANACYNKGCSYNYLSQECQ